MFSYLQIELQMMAENAAQNPTKYNYFFHSNFCHICKSSDKYKVKLCPECRMISYCSEEHRLLHREQHKEICQTIIKISKYRDIWDTRNLTQEKWVKFKKENVQLIKRLLRRELKPYEQQMFLFAKSCLTCHQQDNLIVTCNFCQSINKCYDHRLTDNEHNCENIRQCLQYDFYISVMNQEEERIPENFFDVNTNTVYDMQSFINNVHGNTNIYSHIWSLEDYIYTDNLSRPLTLFYAMRDANLLDPILLHESFFVYIFAGSFLDFCSLSAWEVILHQFYPNTMLLIAMIEPHLPEKYEIVKICKTCTAQKKILQYDFHCMLFHDFRCFLHTQPDVIVAFNVEFEDDVISMKTIKALQLEACPILFTTKSESKAQKAITKIQEVLGSAHIIPIINKRNEFASLRSYRDYENGSVYYPNQHVVVYRNLLITNDLPESLSQNYQ